MNITFEGAVPDFITEEMQKLSDFVVEYFGPGLDCEVVMVFDDNMAEHEHGFIGQTNDDSYEAEINSNMSYEETIRSIFHEMVHAHQLFSGKLVVEKSNKYWEGQCFSQCEYSDSPWEIEAHQKENDMYSLWEFKYG